MTNVIDMAEARRRQTQQKIISLEERLWEEVKHGRMTVEQAQVREYEASLSRPGDACELS